MELIKFQLNHCYSTFNYTLNRPVDFILKKRTKTKCTFLEVIPNELRREPKLHTCNILTEHDEATNQDFEICITTIGKTLDSISATMEFPVPDIQFSPKWTYIAYSTSGRKRVFFLNILERTDHHVYVELYSSSFKTFIHTKVLKPVNGYYEILNLIVQGEQLTFKSNKYNIRLWDIKKLHKTTDRALPINK